MAKDKHVTQFLDNAIEVARFDLDFDDIEIIDALIGYHERYLKEFSGDDPEDKAWRNELISILREAQTKIVNLNRRLK